MNSAGYSEGFEEKNGKCERKGRLTILKLQGHGGIMHFGNSKDQVGEGGGGNKIWKLSVVWYGYFLELPNVIPSIVARVAEWGFWVREKRKGHTRKEGQEHQQECYCFLHYKHPPDES